MNIVIKYLDRLSVHQIVLFRALFSVFLILIHMRVYKLTLHTKKAPLLITRGLIGTAGLYLFVSSLKSLPLGTAVTIQYLAPLFSLLLASSMLNENASLRVWISALGAFFGIILMERHDLRFGEGEIAIAVLAAVCSGLAHNLVRKLRSVAEPIVVSFYFPAITVPISLYPAIETWTTPTLLEWTFLFLSGAFAYIAQLFMTKAFQAERLDKVVTISYIGSPLAVLIGWSFFGEALPLWAIFGIAVVMVSVYWGSLTRPAR